MTPAAPTRFYSYAVITIAQPPVLVAVELTRQLARRVLESQPEPATLRVRRCKLTLFET